MLKSVPKIDFETIDQTFDLKELIKNLYALVSDLEAKLIKSEIRIKESDALISDLQLKLAQSEARVQELEENKKKNSGNTNGAPRQDVFSKTISSREKSDKRVGGQPGHAGQTRLQVEESDQVEVIELPLDICPVCKKDIKEVPTLKVVFRQVLDTLKEAMPIGVTEYRGLVKRCIHCKKKVMSAFPEGVTAPVQFGSNILAIGINLHQIHGIPFVRTTEVIEDLSGVKISPATIEKGCKKISTPIKGIINTILTQLLLSKVLHADETGLRVNGKTMWVHVVCTSEGVVMLMHEKRGFEGMKNHLQTYRGVLIHDGWESYKQFSCEHGLCNVHHLRALRFFRDVRKHEWGAEIIDFLKEILKEKKELKTQGKNRHPDYELIKLRLTKILEAGLIKHPPPERLPGQIGRMRKSKETNLLLRMLGGIDGVLAFIRDFDIPFDNNLAEQAIRMLKVMQNIVGCWRTKDGAVRQIELRSFAQTIKKQKMNIHVALSEILAGTFDVSKLTFTVAK